MEYNLKLSESHISVVTDTLSSSLSYIAGTLSMSQCLVTGTLSFTLCLVTGTLNFLLCLVTGTLSFTLSLPAGASIPSAASLFLITGDGNVLAPIALPFNTTPATFSLSYTFSSPGPFAVTVVIYNLASAFNFSVSVCNFTLCSIWSICTVCLLNESSVLPCTCNVYLCV